MESFDDQSYTTQDKKYAFTSIYNDRNVGGNVILSNTSIADNRLDFSIQMNRNEHKSHNEGVPQLDQQRFRVEHRVGRSVHDNRKMGFNRRVIFQSAKKSESRGSGYR